MTITYASGQTCSEEHMSIEEMIDLLGQHDCKVTVRCAWADRHSVAAAALGTAYPNFASGQACNKVRIRPAPGSAYQEDGQGMLYTGDALVDLSYSVADVGALDDGTDPTDGAIKVSEQLEPTIEYVKLDHQGFRWTSGTGVPLTKDEAPSRQMRGMNLVRTLYNKTTLHASILTLAGKVNDAQYVSTALGLTFPAETLLFVPPSIMRTIKVDGTKSMNVTLKLSYKEKGWNKFWNPHKAGDDKYDAIWDSAAGAQYKNFPPADMSKWLF